MTRSRAGFFTISMAMLLVAVALTSAALIALSQQTSRRLSRLPDEVQQRYAVAAIIASAETEIERARSPASIWTRTQRRDVIGGVSATLKVFAQPLEEAERACLASAGVSEEGLESDLFFWGGVETSTGRRSIRVVAYNQTPLGALTFHESVDARGGQLECI